MVFMVLYPGVALVAMFIILIIMVMLRHGPRLCGLRHTVASSEHSHLEDEAYDQRISYA